MKVKIFRVLLLIAALASIAINLKRPLATKPVYAQSGCTQEPPAWDRGFPLNTTVYYTMDVGLLPQGSDPNNNPA
jgi:hypothetical protein